MLESDCSMVISCEFVESKRGSKSKTCSMQVCLLLDVFFSFNNFGVELFK